MARGVRLFIFSVLRSDDAVVYELKGADSEPDLRLLIVYLA